MTVPPPASDVEPLPGGPASTLTPAQPQVSALQGNRAALVLLATQLLVSAFCAGGWVTIDGKPVRVGLGLPLGLSLFVTFGVTVLVAFTAFRPTLQALFADSRWRTPPSWGLALGTFALAFLTSRAFSLACVLLFPSSAAATPELRSHGLDLIWLLLAGGLLIPLAEEIAFRGLMMRGQERAAGFGVAAVATTVAFALAHGAPVSIAGILPLAYALARLVQHSGSLWDAVIVHALNNTLALGLGVFLLDRLPKGTDQTAELLSTGTMRLPAAFVALLFGGAVLTVLHLWLTPRPDSRERAAPGPWLSLPYVVIVLLGVAQALLTLPAVQQLLTGKPHIVP